MRRAEQQAIAMRDECLMGILSAVCRRMSRSRMQSPMTSRISWEEPSSRFVSRADDTSQEA